MTDRAQDTEAIRAARIHLARPEDRALLRTRAEHDLTAACIPRQSCLEPEVNELGAVVLALLDESDRLVARLEAAERRLEQQIDEAVSRWHDLPYEDAPPLHEWLGLTWDEYAAYVEHAVAALAAAAPGETTSPSAPVAPRGWAGGRKADARHKTQEIGASSAPGETTGPE